jgi:pilus assembly protein CpaE
MQLYFFNTDIESSELTDLEDRIRSQLPNLRKITRLEEVTGLLSQKGAAAEDEQNYIIFPVLAAEAVTRIVNIAEREHPGVFFIFISREISASDYKRLIRAGGADWVSMQGAPQEILDIISRTNRTEIALRRDPLVRPAMVSFVPTGGGVGNATLAIETAVQIKLDAEGRSRRVCLVDLDVQASHICDYLDIEPRLQMQEIIENPERLDAQLFGLFVSRHAASGVDVLATPRNKQAAVELNMAALDALFHLISERYDLVIVDLPPTWYDWTNEIVSASNLAIIVGFNNIPGLRRIVEILQLLRSPERAPPKIVVALNRCEHSLVRGIARRQHVNRTLGNQPVVYIREDAATANQSLNTGIPISMTSRSSKIAKDIRAVVSLVVGLAPARPQEAGSSNRMSIASPRTNVGDSRH